MALAACSTPADIGRRTPELTLAGTVRDTVVTASAPLMTTPAVDSKAGIPYSRIPAPVGLASAAFTSTQALAARGQTKPTITTAQGVNAATARPRVSGRIARVYVAQGQTVKQGQMVAVLDDALFRLGVKKADADRTRAGADIAVLSAKLDDLEEKKQTVLDQRAKAYDALDQIAVGKKALAAAQSKLDAGVAQIRVNESKVDGGIAQLETAIGQVRAAIAQLEKLPPPLRPPGKLEALKKQLAALESQLAQLETAKAGLARAFVKAEAGQATIDTNGAKLRAGQAQAETGLAKIETALNTIDDGMRKLRRARALARKALPVKDAAVRTAHDQLAQAVIRAPVSGQVLQIMRAGEVAMVNAPVAKIRPGGASVIDTYVTLDQLALARIGTPVRITLDSTDERIPGTVTQVPPFYVFPPSALPTTEVHLLRTVPVTVTLDEGRTLPAGTPVDVTFETTGTVTP